MIYILQLSFHEFSAVCLGRNIIYNFWLTELILSRSHVCVFETGVCVCNTDSPTPISTNSLQVALVVASNINIFKFVSKICPQN